MAPTICSGKKRQTRTIANTNMRRRGPQGSHQLNQALSNIVNYVAKGSLNPRVSGGLRIPTDNQTERNTNTNTANFRNTNIEASLDIYNPLMQQTSATTSAASNRRHQQFSFLSDNAVTSSTHSDTENSFDLRLANEFNSNDTQQASTSTSLAASSATESTTSSSQKETSTSSTTSPACEERRFHRYSSIMQTGQEVEQDENEEEVFNRINDATDLYEDDEHVAATNKETTNQIHSNNITKHYYDCNGYEDTEEEYDFDDMEEARDLNSDISQTAVSDSDMDSDEGDSMTSLDTEKSAKLKRGGNHPLLRDKLLANKTSNIRNTDGLLSIAIKTIKLVKRNQLLQQRLTQLQLETSEFIQSVLSNPENRHFRENIKQKVQEVDNV